MAGKSLQRHCHGRIFVFFAVATCLGPAIPGCWWDFPVFSDLWWPNGSARVGASQSGSNRVSQPVFDTFQHHFRKYRCWKGWHFSMLNINKWSYVSIFVAWFFKMVVALGSSLLDSPVLCSTKSGSPTLSWLLGVKQMASRWQDGRSEGGGRDTSAD